MTFKKITSFEVLSGDDNEDQLVWDSTTHGSFSIKSVVTLIRNETQATLDPGWELIWSSPLPQKVCLFLRLTRHDWLMTNSNRFIWGLTDDPWCKAASMVKRILCTCYRTVRSQERCGITWYLRQGK